MLLVGFCRRDHPVEMALDDVELLGQLGHARGLVGDVAHAVAEPTHPPTQREAVELLKDPRILQWI
jgi:hypothetical protein